MKVTLFQGKEEEGLLVPDPEYLLITRRTHPLQMCYCVTKLHRCFHYDVDNDFVGPDMLSLNG